MNNLNKLYIDKKALQHNYNQIRKHIGDGVKIMPMVKANAYGCGMKEVVKILAADYYAVGNISEAKALKKIVPNSRIMIIYQPLIQDINTIVKNDFLCAVCDLSFVKALDKAAKKADKKAYIHLEIDTGMSRLGLHTDEYVSFSHTLKSLNNVVIEGIFTHYSVADSLTSDSLAYTEEQTKQFIKATQIIEAIIGPIKYHHACSGAAIFNPVTKIFNMVRPGYILYGYYADEEYRKLVNLKPALKLTTKIIKISEYEAGTDVGYNRYFRTNRKTKIATVGIGYANGLFRSLYSPKNKVNGHMVVNGQRAPIAGTICMDTTMLDVADIKGKIKIGDEVAIFDNENVTLDELTKIIDTIGYEFIARISDSVTKIIID